MYFTAVILLEAQGPRTKYTAIVLHGDEATAKKHEEMGFYQGWGTTLDQLVALAKTMWLSGNRFPRPDCENRNKPRVPHISLVFREMWDTAAFYLQPLLNRDLY
jgi:hypothetical protein